MRDALSDTLLLRRYRSDIPASAADPSQRQVIGRAAYVGFNKYRTRTFTRLAPTVASAEFVIANDARAWLFIQNKGPGNIFVNYGVSADLSSLQLAATDALEFIGGADGGSFVPPESVWILADAAATTVYVGEGIYLPPQYAGI